ncbi:MAG: hypothetical protein QXF15_01585 [Candidatus Aenigmatarchaeota archaeon]
MKKKHGISIVYGIIIVLIVMAIIFMLIYLGYNNLKVLISKNL